VSLSKRDLIWAVAAALLTFSLFVVTLRPDVGGTEDSPKFQFVGKVLGTAHSPGYPFYVMATWAFGKLPIGTLAYRINLFSAVCGALACMVIFLTARRLGVTRLLSMAAALAAATTFPVWSNSVTAEVYTLAAVLSGGAIYWLIAFAQTGTVWRLYAACALWACGFGNHLTIVGILPAALVYGIYRDRRVLQPRVAITAAIIGLMGVAQYWFIAIRTMQGAPYLEARADTILGVFNVIIAKDVEWARFYQAQSAVAEIEVPMLLNGIRMHMGTIAIALVVIAILIGIWKRNPEVLVIFGAAAGTLGMIANLWGDVVGFITPVCVQLWPLAAFGLQQLVQASRPAGQQASRRLAAAGAIALIAPIANFITIHPEIEQLRTPGEGPGVRALYSHLPQRSAIVAENYWLARLINYMHYSGEVAPDPNPRVLDSDPVDVRKALADGLQVYAFEGATHWLDSQGFVFERTGIALEPFETWIAQQPNGTLIAVAAAGRPLPFEWLPAASRPHGGRPSNFGVFTWTIGDGSAGIEQNDAGAATQQVVGSEHRVLTITSNEDGPQLLWGEDVIVAIDRGLAVAAFSPAGALIGQWSFSLDETPGVQLPPAPYLLHGESACDVLRPGQPADVAALFADGAVLATVEGGDKAIVTLDTDAAADEWRLRFSNGRGNASIEPGSQLMLEPFSGTRAVFRLSMPPAPSRAIATLTQGANAVRICAAATPPLPADGSFEVGAEQDAWFGAGWHLGERAGTQRFRWSARSSSLMWKMDKASRVRMLLRLRPANANGATLRASINGAEVASCKLPGGAWTECSVDIPESSTQSGINQLTLSADTISPSADRPGDARELSFVMQASRVRVGQ
jgi:hypothetical protein